MSRSDSPTAAIILHNLAPQLHGHDVHHRLGNRFRPRRQRQIVVARAQRSCHSARRRSISAPRTRPLGQTLPCRPQKFAHGPVHILDAIRKTARPRLNTSAAPCALANPFANAQPEPDRQPPLPDRLQRAIPTGLCSRKSARISTPCLLCVAHDLRRPPGSVTKLTIPPAGLRKRGFRKRARTSNPPHFG